MPVLQFKGKTAMENYHHTVPHHRLEFDAKLSLLAKGEKPSLDGNLIIEGDNLLALKALLPTHAGRVKCVYIAPPLQHRQRRLGLQRQPHPAPVQRMDRPHRRQRRRRRLPTRQMVLHDVSAFDATQGVVTRGWSYIREHRRS
jgi:hypothetical protein